MALVLRTDQENAEYIERQFGQLRQGRARRIEECLSDAIQIGPRRSACARSPS